MKTHTIIEMDAKEEYVLKELVGLFFNKQWQDSNTDDFYNLPPFLLNLKM